MLDKEATQLAEREAVAIGEGVLAHKRCEARVDDVAFDVDTIDGVWPVEHYDLRLCARRGAQGERDGVGERVVPGADILQVADEHVDVVQVLPLEKEALPGGAIE